jgi:formylglycine-generating enzyme required for sulfatase activity
VTRRTRLNLLERATLALTLGCAVSLARPPKTQAALAQTSAWSAGTLGPSSADVALSGGLAILRGKGSQMIRIAASEFVMGSTTAEIVDATVLCEHEPLASKCDERGFADEQPPHRVTLSGFYLDRREVTVEEYQACVRVGRCKAPPYARGARRFQQPTFPVTLVTWDDARSFCAFRGARLPSEAEFERAARGLTGRRFPWGQLPNDHLANHGRLGLDVSDDRDGFAELAPVGSYSDGRTPDGFLDLAGNAAEWLQDRYAPEYPEGAVKDPTGPDAALATSARVVRGGSYESPLAWLRGAARGAFSPNERRPSLGFRCARSRAGVKP